MGFFNVEIEGMETLQADLNKEVGAIYRAVPSALQLVGSEMILDLQKHINEDFYDKYDPVAYPRRRDFPAFGTPIIDASNMDISVNGLSLAFTYSPMGFHSGQLKDTLNWNESSGNAAMLSGEYPIKPNPVHGDDLIRRLQTGKGYDWHLKKGKDFPARPFWDKFVDEQINERISQNFVRGMNLKGYTVISENEDVIADGNEKV